MLTASNPEETRDAVLTVVANVVAKEERPRRWR